jgi:ubiquinone/menaquinone biosynthesis C-methylase UbiE
MNMRAMTWTSLFRIPEPPPWLYAIMAKSGLLRGVYGRFAADLAAALPAGALLLDVGTGPGYLPEHLAGLRPDVEFCGLDLSPRMIRYAQGRQEDSPCHGRCHWVAGDAQQLPFAAQVFDHCVASFSLHHWPNPLKGLTEMLRVLKPGGRAWIYELQRQTPYREIKAFARAAGLPLVPAYLALKPVSWHHALAHQDFERLLIQTAAPQWGLTAVHRIFWRAEMARI